MTSLYQRRTTVRYVQLLFVSPLHEALLYAVGIRLRRTVLSHRLCFVCRPLRCRCARVCRCGLVSCRVVSCRVVSCRVVSCQKTSAAATMTPLSAVDPASWDPHNLMGRYHLWKIKSKFPIPGSAVLNDARRRAFESVVDAAEQETAARRKVTDNVSDARRCVRCRCSLPVEMRVLTPGPLPCYSEAMEKAHEMRVASSEHAVLLDKVQAKLNVTAEAVRTAHIDRLAPVALHGNLDLVFKLMETKNFERLEDMMCACVCVYVCVCVCVCVYVCVCVCVCV